MNHFPSPLVSIIIPTHKRPHLLPRAIRSALESAPDGNTEVIVVPNGPDRSWTAVEDQFTDDRRVRWLPLEEAQVSLARNHGLRAAQGKFVRFLDDDDFLCKEGCAKQCELAIRTNADICSGAISAEYDNGKKIKTLHQPKTDDFVVAMLCPARRPYPIAHLIRRSILESIWWNENLSVNEDTEWLIRILLSKEIKWVTTSEHVGAWVQHRGARLSRGRDPGKKILQDTAEMILNAAQSLEKSDRLSEQRKIAIADGLWSLLQKGLRYDGVYWRNIADIANTYAPNRTPPSRIYRLGMTKNINPLLIETLLIPVRCAYHPVRRVLESFGLARA